MSMRTTRRGFLKRTMATAGTVAATGLVGAPRILADAKGGSKLGVAVVGAGGMGGYSVNEACKETFVAIVDIDEKRMAKAMEKVAKKGQKPKVYHDYRKMLDECHKDLDVVLVATPDHHHAPAAIRAIDLGKHAFCQKPLAYSIDECYKLAAAAKAKKVQTQMGNQRHCGERIRRLSEMIRDGAVGEVTETHTILGRNFGGSGGRPDSKPVPEGVHWQEWIGPSPYREYHDGLHPFSWRNYKLFGTGTIGDMACHHVDFPFTALKLGEARSFKVTCLNRKNGSEEKWSQDNIVRYDVPARGDMPAVKVFVYDHKGLMPAAMREAQEKHGRKFGEYTLFVGSKGLIGSDCRMMPDSMHKGYEMPEKTIPRAHGGPISDLYWAIKNDGTACSNFIDAAGPLTAFALCGHLAQAAGVGKTVEWDVEKMECTNIPEVNELVRRSYREGWEV